MELQIHSNKNLIIIWPENKIINTVGISLRHYYYYY